MKKILAIVFMVAMFAMSVSAQMVLNGHVYESDINSPGVPGVTVYVECGDSIDLSEAATTMTDANGEYEYVFDGCDAATVTAAISEANVKTATWAEVGEGLNLFFADIDFNVPEFTTIGAALALVGAGYVAYRKRD